MLMKHILKRNPGLAKKIFSNFIDTTLIKNFSKEEIISFMTKTEKGTICKWINENGEEVYLVNNGRNFFTNSKQILIFGSRMSKKDL